MASTESVKEAWRGRMDIRGAQGKKDKKNRKRMLDYRKVYNLKGKILASTLGIVVISLGIALCRMGNVGVDPFTAMNMGLSEIVGIGFGTFQLIMNAVILTAVFFLDRSQIGIFTVVAALGTGPLITMWNKFATLNLYRKFKILNKQELVREATV